MTMTAPNHNDDLDLVPADTDHVRVETSAVAILNRSEVETQIDAAHRHRRSIRHFRSEAISLATLSQSIAEACMYTLPRGGKPITGPSVRLAEIVASAYGNLHVGARIIDEDDRFITAQGVAWDLEKNLRVTVEVKRRITDRGGRKFNDDMVGVTGNAASSIALRNAILRVVPRAYVTEVYEAAKKVAVGDAKTLASRREEVIVRLQKIGVPVERIYAKLGKRGIEDVDLEDLENLIGLGTAIKNGDVKIDEAFPPIEQAPAAPDAPEGRRVKLGGAKQAAPAPAPAPVDPPEPGSDG